MFTIYKLAVYADCGAVDYTLDIVFDAFHHVFLLYISAYCTSSEGDPHSSPTAIEEASCIERAVVELLAVQTAFLLSIYEKMEHEGQRQYPCCY